jgi:hypothetical protein
MAERRQPEFDPEAAVRAVADGLPDIETPVINIQDLAPRPQPSARVNDSGVEMQSSPGSGVPDDVMLADDEQAVREALAEFDKEYARLRSAKTTI